MKEIDEPITLQFEFSFPKNPKSYAKRTNL